MLTMLAENISTIVLCVVLIAVVATIVIKLVKNRRAGKSSCGCGCAGCAMKNACHKRK